METFSTLLAICVGNSPVTGEFPPQRPLTQSSDVFFDLHLNKQLSKHWETSVTWDAIAPYDVIVMEIQQGNMGQDAHPKTAGQTLWNWSMTKLTLAALGTKKQQEGQIWIGPIYSMRQWIRSALVQIMACRLFGAKPLSKPVLDYYQLGPQEPTAVKF